MINSNVAFVDLLGASDLMDHFDDQELRRLLRVMRNNVDFFDVWPAYEGPDRVVTFSDNVCACRPVEDDEIDGGLAWHVIASGQFQRNLTLNGYFVRGGITVGPVYADEGTVMGAPLVQAYTLEKETVHPRVALDREHVLTFALGAIAEGDLYGSLQNRCALVDEADGTVFVNYLEFLTESDNEAEFYESLARHRDVVAQRVEQFHEDEKVGPKYRWSARYHNWVCDVLFELPEYRIDDAAAGTEDQVGFAPLIEWLEREVGWDVIELRQQWFGPGH